MRWIRFQNDGKKIGAGTFQAVTKIEQRIRKRDLKSILRQVSMVIGANFLPHGPELL